ncbi:MAG: RdgB/HAM1 family non-canonical purine NTP pyrophosphatase [Lachnospirales bacterium]
MKIVFATQNKGKINELKEMFSDLNIDVLSMGEVGLDLDIEETGVTFFENAKIKSEALYNALENKEDYIVMSDDSGIEIEALDNKPGVYSARYNGVDTPWITKNQMMIEEMKNFTNRNARFVSCIYTIMPNGEAFEKFGVVEGEISFELLGDKGFGYDMIFIPKGYDKSFSQMSLDEKNSISHRGRAIEVTKEKLKSIL